MSEKKALPQSALELIEFPSRFPLKVFGTKNEKFEVDVLSLVKAHCSVNEKIETTSRESKNGKYTALTITFTASSKDQLEDIYQDLHDCDQVVMTL
jgi:putative lipoic acid-binding regulatory protein|tara:strand:+ start:6828 stop:7115 length:288 start_codon:yes stop_codon:yes gene_type:complete